MTNLSHNEAIMQELLQTFHEEAADHLTNLNQALLTLERTGIDEANQPLLQSAFRAAHSLKGAARAVSQESIQTIAHRMEDVLKAVRDEGLALTPDVCDVLYDALDTMQTLLKGQTVDHTALLAALDALQGNKPGTTTAKSAAPPAPEEGTVPDPADKARPVDAEETIRVSVAKLDTLMAEVGELLIAQRNSEHHGQLARTLRNDGKRLSQHWQTVWTRLKRLDQNAEATQFLWDALQSYQQMTDDLLKQVGQLDTIVHRDTLRLSMVMNNLQDDMRRVRMVPFSTQEAYLQRIVRDAAREENKQVQLTITGLDAELDKKVLELLKDPLMHLLRNAVGHGIEQPADREKAQKSARGTIKIMVQQRGSEAHITVSDDGCGFMLDALRDGLPHGQDLSEDDLISRAFLPGVTTAATITAISGRGVGLDVVRKQIEALQGRIKVDTTVGEGSTIQLIVPVSLAITRVLLVTVGEHTYAVPLASVEKLLKLDHTFRVEGRDMVRYNGKSLLLVALADILQCEAAADAPENPLVIILASADQMIALQVDDVLTEQEIAVKSFSYPLVRVKHLSGASLLGNGSPVTVLNVADVVQSAREVSQNGSARPSDTTRFEDTISARNILVVDDSITTRTLEKNILQAAGYQVTTAMDGLEALEALKRVDIDLVVADVEMPNMDGITLTKHLRQEDTTRNLPLILVTSLESNEDRERGMVAGANAYIVKRGFSQSELLDTIEQFL